MLPLYNYPRLAEAAPLKTRSASLPTSMERCPLCQARAPSIFGYVPLDAVVVRARILIFRQVACWSFILLAAHVA